LDMMTQYGIGQSNGGLAPPRLVEIRREPLNGWERLIKRALDLVLAVVAAVLLAPVLLVTAVAIKIDSNGSVLFRQRRVGFENREFLIYKFRTMTVMEDGEAVVQARCGDNTDVRCPA
jgi:putative colanic acid biosysnthesis UDP-glucose lipid carrier transferase